MKVSLSDTQKTIIPNTAPLPSYQEQTDFSQKIQTDINTTEEAQSGHLNTFDTLKEAFILYAMENSQKISVGEDND